MRAERFETSQHTRGPAGWRRRAAAPGWHRRVAGACVAACLFWVVAGFAAERRPNIVVILSDDMGFSDIGCYGGEISTPNLDRVAAGGIRFTQFYNACRCCPTRAALLTGLYPHEAGMGHMSGREGPDAYQGELSDQCVTIAEVLRTAGYRTYLAGKWHVSRNKGPRGSKHDWPLQRGFDRFYGTIAAAGSYFDPGTLTRGNTAISPFTDPEYQPKEYYYTDAITDHAIRFVDDHQREHAGEPFFLYVAYTAAHWPLHAKPGDIAKYRGRYDAGYEPIRQARFKRLRQMGLIDPDWELATTVGDWASVENKEWEARCMEVYAAQIDCMDQGVGRIVAELRKQGQLDNTLLMFLEDNGGASEVYGRTEHMERTGKPMFPPIAMDATREDVRPVQNRRGMPMLKGPGVMPGPEDTFMSYGGAWANVSNTPFRDFKRWLHEGGIATPLIISWPSRIHAGGELRRQIGHVIDILPTCIEVAGASYPTEVRGRAIKPLEGTSLVPTFDNREIERNPLFWEHEGSRAVRDGKWKLVARGPTGKWELYDMEKDRTEMHDLAASQPRRVEVMVLQWEEFAARAHVLPWIAKPAYVPLARRR